MIKVNIKAVVDYRQLTEVIRSSPFLEDIQPVAAFQCGPFECETIEEVWAVAKQIVIEDRQATYQKLKEFAP